MAARPGMTTIILELRSLTDAAEEQTVIGDVSYWTDDQLQDILDKYRQDVLDTSLTPYSAYDAGVWATKRYYIPDSVNARYVENDTSVLSVVDSLGNPAPAYTFDVAGRQFNFTDDTQGTAYFMRARLYDIRLAAAYVWLQKAAHRVALIDWKAGGQTLSEDQEYQHCMEMYKLFSGYKGIQATRLTKVGYRGQ